VEERKYSIVDPKMQIWESTDPISNINPTTFFPVTLGKVFFLSEIRLLIYNTDKNHSKFLLAIVKTRKMVPGPEEKVCCKCQLSSSLSE
jgi:hypothetical protein